MTKVIDLLKSRLIELATYISTVRWDASQGSYVTDFQAPYSETVPEWRVIAYQQQYSEHITERIAFATHLFTIGQTTLQQWQEHMAKHMKNGWVVSSAIGRGGREAMERSDWGRVGGRLAFEYRKLNEFALEIEAGNLTENQIRARAVLYGRATRTGYWDGLTHGKLAAGFTHERRFLHPAEHCYDCIKYALTGVQLIGTLPEPGEACECMRNCKCSKAYYREEDLWRLPTLPGEPPVVSSVTPLPDIITTIEQARRLSNEKGVGFETWLTYDVDDVWIEVANVLSDIYRKVPKRCVDNIRLWLDKNQYTPSKKRIDLDAMKKAFLPDTIQYLRVHIRSLESKKSRAASPTPPNVLPFTDFDQKQLNKFKTKLEMIESGDLKRYHSVFYVDDSRFLEMVLRHEFGHAFEDEYNGGALIGGYAVPGLSSLFYDNRQTNPDTGVQIWKEKFGVTARARDSWDECVAENFTLWSIGRTENMHPEMIRRLNRLTGYEGWTLP